MQTATIEVKYVNPPKDGKQYGSIKGADNETWPVKKDRIREFEPGNTYELAYTLGNNEFKNIIGVKRLDKTQSAQGQFTTVPMRNGATLTATAPVPAAVPRETISVPKATQAEQIFATGGIYRDVEMGRVGTTEEELVERTVMWRNVYRRAFPE